MLLHFIRKDSIAKSFIVGILIFSSCVTFILTAIQLFFDYSRDVGLIEEKLNIIEAGYQQSFAESLWVLDNEQLEVQIKGVLKIPDIQCVEIRKGKQRLFYFGQVTSINNLSRQFKLSYNYGGRNKNLGTCYVYADLDRVYQRLIDKAIIILLGQGAKTFLVSLFIFFLFYNLIGKHLKSIARYTQQLDLKKEQPLILERNPGKIPVKDELYLVTESINKTVKSLRISYKELYSANSNLEKEIIERIKAEDSLNDNNSLLNAIIEGTTDVIFLKNLNGQYVLANKACLQALGRSEDEVIGKDDHELFPPESVEVIHQIDSSVIQSGKACLVEERLKTAYGNTYWLSNKSPRRDKDGNINGLIGIARNITDFKNAEQAKADLEKQLQQAQKMEALGTLAGGIAHDFNNILSVILGYSEMIKDDLSPENRSVKKIDAVLKAGRRAKDLVTQILAFSRQSEKEVKPVQPHLIIKEALKMLRASIPSTIEIHQDIPDCGYITGDPTQVHQIMMNLCTNAYYAMRATGGVLRVVLTSKELETEDVKYLSMASTPAPYIKLEISDTGQGIEKEHLKTIFDPYFTTKKKGEGTGLGLSIVHGIVKRFGGSISVNSEPASGTTFNVFLPKIPSAANPSPEKRSEPMPTGTEHIMIVDDEESIMQMQKQMLKSLGYRVTAFAGSLEALNAFTADPHKFNLVITDMTMPHMTGLQLSREIKACGTHIPVIVCTGFSDQINGETSKNMDIQGYVAKPVLKRQIARTVRDVLDNSLKTQAEK